MAERLRALLNHGSVRRYRHESVGTNSRLDSLQAAVLRVKLRHFEAELGNRQRAAARYSERLRDRARVPVVREGHASAWAQYTLRVPDRDRVQARLAAKGIPTAIHYPIPLHAQPAFAHLKIGDDACPIATQAAREVLSLPMHGMLAESQIAAVCLALEEELP
jgi:UDP-2-acetamido-2-deoxy-ribo-hexuluronate aminotransferase